MDSPGIDLDMTLTSSPIQRVVAAAPENWEMNDVRTMNDKHGIFQPSIITKTVSKGHSNDNSNDNNNNDGTIIVLLSKNNNDNDGKGITAESEQPPPPPTNNNATEEEERSNTNNNVIVNGNITKKYYNKTMTIVELWKEEISMMNVTNTILLNDLVNLGADM